MPDAVFFFVLSGQFMFFDLAGIVFGCAHQTDYSCLYLSSHLLPVYIKAGRFILQKYAFCLHLKKVMLCHLVNQTIIAFCSVGHVNFRFLYVHEAQSVAQNGFLSLFPGHNIVRKSRYLRNKFLLRTYRFKR